MKCVFVGHFIWLRMKDEWWHCVAFLEVRSKQLKRNKSWSPRKREIMRCLSSVYFISFHIIIQMNKIPWRVDGEKTVKEGGKTLAWPITLTIAKNSILKYQEYNNYYWTFSGASNCRKTWFYLHIFTSFLFHCKYSGLSKSLLVQGQLSGLRVIPVILTIL